MLGFGVTGRTMSSPPSAWLSSLVWTPLCAAHGPCFPEPKTPSLPLAVDSVAPGFYWAVVYTLPLASVAGPGMGPCSKQG